MWTVKLPVYDPFNRLDLNNWDYVDSFDSQEEAIEFVKKEFGAYEDGTVQLVYEGD